VKSYDYKYHLFESVEKYADVKITQKKIIYLNIAKMTKSDELEVSPIFEVFLKSSSGKTRKRTIKLFTFFTIVIVLAVILVAVPLFLLRQNPGDESMKMLPSLIYNDEDSVILLLGGLELKTNQITANIETVGTIDSCDRIPK
jgi:hypothetical protein